MAQTYRFKIDVLSEHEGGLDVRFEFLAGVYQLEESGPDYAALYDALLGAKKEGREVEFTVQGSRIVRVGGRPPLPSD